MTTDQCWRCGGAPYVGRLKTKRPVCADCAIALLDAALGTNIGEQIEVDLGAARIAESVRAKLGGRPELVVKVPTLYSKVRLTSDATPCRSTHDGRACEIAVPHREHAAWISGEGRMLTWGDDKR